MNRETPFRRRLGRAVGAGLIVAGTLIGALAVTSTTASAADYDPASNGFTPDGVNSFGAEDALNASCPEAILATPGSGPANKAITGGWTGQAANFAAGGTIQYTYWDNPNADSRNFNIEDCVVRYPASKFSAAEFDATTGELLTSYTKQQLVDDAVELDKATLTQVDRSGTFITYKWSAPDPSKLTPGSWICNIARDTSTGHGGDGNRKVNPICFQVPLTSVPRPTITPSDPCGSGNATVTIPETTGVTFHSGTAAGTVLTEGVAIPLGAGLTIVGVADSGYTLGSPTQSGNWVFGPFTETNTTACPTVPRPTLVVSDPCGTGNATVTIPTTDGATFHSGSPTGTVLAEGSAIPVPGGGLVIYGVADGATPLASPNSGANWLFDTVTETNTTACPTVPRPTLVVSDPCGTGNATVTIPTTNGATFYSGSANSPALAEGVTIPIPAEGLTIYGVADGQTPLAPPTQEGIWVFDTVRETNTSSCGGGGGTVLLDADPTDPRIDRDCGETDQYRVPSSDGVIYRVNGVETESGWYDLEEGEEVVITAHPAAGYQIPAGQRVEWTFEGQAMEDCPVPEEPEEPVVEEPPAAEPGQVETPREEPAPAPAPAAAPVLAFTGLETAELLMTAVFLLLSGVALLLASKRQAELLGR